MANSNINSDDEFHDALPAEDDIPSSSKTIKINNDGSLDEILKQSKEVVFDDEEDPEQPEAVSSAPQVEEELFEMELSENELLNLEKDLTTEQLNSNKERADKLKLEANELFKNDKAQEAVNLYTEALNICPVANTKERSILFANRAAAKIKLEANKSAIDDCNKAIDLWPDYVRCLLRRAKLFEGDDKLDEALKDYSHIIELDPGQSDAREAMVRLPPIIKERNEKLKDEMIDKLKDLGNMFLKPFGLSTDSFQMQQDPNSGSYSINLKQ